MPKAGQDIITQAKIATSNLLQHYEMEKMKALDKMILDDLKQRMQEHTNIIKQDFSSVQEKQQAMVARLSIKVLYDNVKLYIKERNQKIKNKIIMRSDAYNVTFEKYYTMNGIVPGYAKNTQKDFEDRFYDKLHSNIFTDIQNKIAVVTNINLKLQELTVDNYDEFNFIVKNSKTELVKHRDSGGVTSKFWEKINAVLKKFSMKSDLELGITGAQYLDTMHSIFKRHKRHQKKLEKEAQKKNTRKL